MNFTCRVIVTWGYLLTRWYLKLKHNVNFFFFFLIFFFYYKRATWPHLLIFQNVNQFWSFILFYFLKFVSNLKTDWFEGFDISVYLQRSFETRAKLCMKYLIVLKLSMMKSEVETLDEHISSKPAPLNFTSAYFSLSFWLIIYLVLN